MRGRRRRRRSLDREEELARRERPARRRGRRERRPSRARRGRRDAERAEPRRRRRADGREAPERLQKILARAGIASRRKAEELIAGGRVTVNGKVAVAGRQGRSRGRRDQGRRQARAAAGAAALHPAQQAAGLRHHGRRTPSGRPTVIDLVPPALRKALVPVGRLDFQTEGLLLLTDDGEFAQRISHPRYGCAQDLRGQGARGRPTSATVERLRERHVDRGAAHLARRGRGCCARTGRGRETAATPGGRSGSPRAARRQIREMFFRIGHAVQKLRRVAIGPLRDAELPVGALARALRARGRARCARPAKHQPPRLQARSRSADGEAERGREPASAPSARGAAAAARPPADRRRGPGQPPQPAGTAAADATGGEARAERR